MKKKKLIPNHNDAPIIDLFIMALRDYLPIGNYEPIISQEEQNKVLEKLKANTVKAKFSFVIDGLSGELKHCEGVEKWLGYPDKTFTTKKFFEITHPAHVIAHWMNGTCIWDITANKKEFTNFYDISMVYTLALKHCNGNYIYCSCESFYFQVSSEYKGMEFGYEYTVLRDFDKGDFNISFFDKNGPRQDMVHLLDKAKKEKFKSAGLFSIQEMRMLNHYAYKEKSKSADIATSFKIDQKTVFTHNTNILDKAEHFFYFRFDSAKKFALHLKALKLI